MAPSLVPSEQSFLLDGVDWMFYESLLERIGGRHVFITFDRGRLELMSASWKHATRSRRIAMLITIVADELGVPLQGGGSTTFRREDIAVGLEPDQCFYVQHVDQVRGKEDIDLAVDPAPDLAVEVEISRRSLDREAIYACLGVPELWRDDGQTIRAYRLMGDGRYEVSSHSLSFPGLAMEQVEDRLREGTVLDDATWGRAVRASFAQRLPKDDGVPRYSGHPHATSTCMASLTPMAKAIRVSVASVGFERGSVSSFDIRDLSMPLRSATSPRLSPRALRSRTKMAIASSKAVSSAFFPKASRVR
jgi:Uma2 family endonuclease